MRLKLYRAASVAEAMALVRAELGPDALILSTRRLAQGVELTAALDQADPPEPEPALTLEPPDTSPAPPFTPLPAARKGLGFHGLPASLAARLAGPDLAQSLRAALRFGMLPLVRDGAPVLLAGMPGAGKTLSVARLATRLVMAGISPLVITADGRRAGAAEELAAYTRLLGVGLVVASTPATLARALAQRQPDMPVLIDTAGINPFAEAELADLRALAGTAKAAAVLVMPAGQDLGEATEQAEAFAPLGARHLLATRLDLARRLGSILGAAAAADLILTEAGIGTGATDGLTPLTPEFLADRIGQSPEPPKFPVPWVPTQTTAPPRQAQRPVTNWIRG
jgi:flagellar biosynthesis protein FlhF